MKFEDFDDKFDYLLSSGAIEFVRLNDSGEPVYKVTQKCKDIFPELYNEHYRKIDDIAFRLWQLDVINIVFTEKAEIVSFTKENLDRFIELEDTLTEQELAFVDVLFQSILRDANKKLNNDKDK